MREVRGAFRRVLFSGAIVTAIGALGSLGTACLTVPVVAGSPDLNGQVNTEIRETGVDKIDLLFAIDNSASMGDKQQILSEAIPDLLERLLIPECVDPDDPSVRFARSQNGACARGELEFKPIKDIHVGIVSSSLGGRGSGSCADARTDDKGRLLNIGKSTNGPLPEASPANLLAWFPGPGAPASAPAVPTISDVQKLVRTFQDLVEGVGETGCGFEGQLESWYRFLVQPDPYASVELDGARAVLKGVDDTLLKQRKAFLRPDSLVAIIQVTDENESTVDPLSLGGFGSAFAAETRGKIGNGEWNIDQLKATAACAADPDSASCGSCLDTRFKGMPECKEPEGKREYSNNLRFFDMKRRFGIDPRFPVARYVRGLGREPSTGAPLARRTVPDRQGEHPSQEAAYTQDGSCTNPLFAESLPESSTEELCLRKQGKRDPSLVYFATITGVPNKLLHFDPKSREASTLSPEDWVKILGRDPEHHDVEGADPRMLESAAPRAGLASTGDDGQHTREWDTRDASKVYQDLQYACTFTLKTPRRCEATSCDCVQTPDSPLCDPGDPKLQLRAKAYPGVRHLQLAKALGDHGIVSSICPIEPKDTASELYGYRPAVRVIVDRLKDSLTTQCLERPLHFDVDAAPPCVVIEVLPDAGSDEACAAAGRGLSPLDARARAAFVERHRDGIADIERRPICQAEPLVVAGGGSCKNDARPGFCYVRGDQALAATRQKCASAILFSRAGSPAAGTNTVLQCVTSEEAAPSAPSP